MKKILLSVALFFLVATVFAQKSTDGERTAESATKILVEKYQLTKAQEAKMLKIQTRMLKNSDEIAPLESSNIEKYLQKMSSNEQQTNFSIRMMLDEEQVKILNKEEMDLREKRAGVSSKMQKDGASPLEIKKALIKVD